ncbi:MAG: hypothetical protein L3J70_11035 [Gammaproteobacteria bacterium]|nr:hypothetical protein [Gammaproteobacteria bacterium]
MASISSIKLELLNHNHQTKTAKVKVSYKVYLTCVERNMKCLRFREEIQLWGDDANPNPDDYLYTFPTSSFLVEQNGVVNRSRTVTISDDILDEDDYIFNRTDEVYAKVSVKPLLPSTSRRNSNVIKHKF